MTHTPQEDAPYIPTQVDDFAIEDNDILDGTVDTGAGEELATETQLIKDIRIYLKEAESEHNTFDIIDLTEQAKMTPTQQIAVHKLVVKHLRNIGAMINEKVREN